MSTVGDASTRSTYRADGYTSAYLPFYAWPRYRGCMAVYAVRVFEVSPSVPGDVTGPKPRPLAGFQVEGPTVDLAKKAVRLRAVAMGRTVRSLSFTTDGAISVVLATT